MSSTAFQTIILSVVVDGG